MGYGVPYSGKDRTPSYISEQDMREKHFAPFLEAIRAGALSVMVNSGINNGMPFSINLGCGTWGGNITSENITYKNYLNTTWVVREIPGYKVPEDDELFGEEMRDAALFDGI